MRGRGAPRAFEVPQVAELVRAISSLGDFQASVRTLRHASLTVVLTALCRSGKIEFLTTHGVFPSGMQDPRQEVGLSSFSVGPRPPGVEG